MARAAQTTVTSMPHWPITLDDAMRIVLHECPNKTATTTFIADEINRRRLYIQKDGGPVFAEQMFLRARHYPDLFEIPEKGRITSLPAPRKRRAKK